MENPYNKLILGYRMKQQSTVEIFINEIVTCFFIENIWGVFLYIRYHLFPILVLYRIKHAWIEFVGLKWATCMSCRMFSSRAEGHTYDTGLLFRCPDVELCVIGPDPEGQSLRRFLLWGDVAEESYSLPSFLGVIRILITRTVNSCRDQLFKQPRCFWRKYSFLVFCFMYLLIVEGFHPQFC